jgi:O-antigen/teichoic acid export membrane protein
LALLGIRSELVANFSWESTGYWQAVWQISNGYMAVLTTGLSVYYLPKLASTNTTQELGREMSAYFRLVIPLALLVASSIYLFRDIVLQLFFSKDFLVVADLLAWQLCADVIRVATWGYGYLLVAKGMSLVFVGREAGFGVAYYIGTLIMLPHWGLGATVKVYAVLCAINGLFVVWYVKRWLATDPAHQ